MMILALDRTPFFLSVGNNSKLLFPTGLFKGTFSGTTVLGIVIRAFICLPYGLGPELNYINLGRVGDLLH